MTNIKNYGQEAELACKNEPGYQVKMAELQEIFQNSNCEGDMISPYSDYVYGSIKAEIAENYYTCAPFVHQKNVISNANYDNIIQSSNYNGLCPEGYDVKDLTNLKSGHTVVTCMGVIEDATAGQSVYGNCAISEV